MTLIIFAYILLIGFFAYASAKASWHRLKVGIKVLIAPAFICFGIMDVLFNVTIGSILFLDIPRDVTFSQRCSRHLLDSGVRGKIAGAFAVLLNAIDTNHVR